MRIQSLEIESYKGCVVNFENSEDTDNLFMILAHKLRFFNPLMLNIVYFELEEKAILNIISLNPTINSRAVEEEILSFLN